MVKYLSFKLFKAFKELPKSFYNNNSQNFWAFGKYLNCLLYDLPGQPTSIILFPLALCSVTWLTFYRSPEALWAVLWVFMEPAVLDN
jgi:hypothetical protein